MPGSLSCLPRVGRQRTDDLDALALVVIGEVDETVFVGNDDRAMVAEEDQDDHVFLDVAEGHAGILPVVQGGNAGEGGGLFAHADGLVELARENRAGHQAQSGDGQKRLPHRCMLLREDPREVQGR